MTWRRSRLASFGPRAICNALRNERFGFADPATAHRLVEIRIRLEVLRLRRDERKLGVEERLLRVSDLEIDRRPFLVALLGEVAKPSQLVDVVRLFVADLLVLDTVHQCV